MTSGLLKDLNPEQQQAVLATNGPTIILAGAGSGKTRVLTYKVLYLMLEKNIPAESILMVTFTNKAAKEMKERILHALAEQRQTAAIPTVATFHSLCAKILRIEGKHLGFSQQFTIYDSQDQIDAIKEAMKQLDLSVKDFKPHSIHATISEAKNELLTPEEYVSFARGTFQQAVAKVYPLYQKILKANDALDFDDLISYTIRLFRENDQIREKYRNRFEYILIDEYQDTNRAQYTLTRLLVNPEGPQNVCVVGDFSQSIYSWRGADYHNLLRFKDDFPGAKTFSLSQNYRSTQKILDAASTVIAKNKSHPVLKLWTENPDGEEIEIYEAMNEQDEADFIIRTVANLGLKNLSKVAVLYRTNAQSRVMEEALLHHALPYVLIGGTRFYERKEIKDVLCYLRLINNPSESIAYKRAEKLGKGRLAKFLAYQSSVILVSEERTHPESTQQKDAGQASMTTIDLLDGVVRATGYLELYDDKIEEDRQRLENIKELRSVAMEFPLLFEFLENVALVEQEYDSEKNAEGKITLMTLHAAKGLEFPIVFIIGMEEGLFPHSRSLMDREQLEEERRLCYVGMTRAKEKLYMTYAKRRLFFGQRATNTVSRFVLEMPEEMISHIKYESWESA
ncbi:MAG: UvrD-helicase domain-containing protein [Patescibacteria group bacterium]